MELIAAITATSFAAAISPLSTGGAIIMSSYSASKGTTNDEMNTLFKNLFLLSVANVLVNVLMSALGVLSISQTCPQENVPARQSSRSPFVYTRSDPAAINFLTKLLPWM